MKSNLKTHFNNFLYEGYADICISANDTYAVWKKDGSRSGIHGIFWNKGNGDAVTAKINISLFNQAQSPSLQDVSVIQRPWCPSKAAAPAPRVGCAADPPAPQPWGLWGPWGHPMGKLLYIHTKSSTCKSHAPSARLWTLPVFSGLNPRERL